MVPDSTTSPANNASVSWAQRYKSIMDGRTRSHDHRTDAATICQPIQQSVINEFNLTSGQSNGFKLSPKPNVSPVYNHSFVTPTHRQSQSQHPATATPENNANNSSFASEDSESTSPSSNLERSQSFKMSKKVQKSLAKGGSLRLSKKDAVNLKEVQDNFKNEDAESTHIKRD